MQCCVCPGLDVTLGWCVGMRAALVDDVHVVKKSMELTNFVLLVN